VVLGELDEKRKNGSGTGRPRSHPTLHSSAMDVGNFIGVIRYVITVYGNSDRSRVLPQSPPLCPSTGHDVSGPSYRSTVYCFQRGGGHVVRSHPPVHAPGASRALALRMPFPGVLHAHLVKKKGILFVHGGTRQSATKSEILYIEGHILPLFRVP
jgi:hypothetical protein